MGIDIFSITIVIRVSYPINPVKIMKKNKSIDFSGKNKAFEEILIQIKDIMIEVKTPIMQGAKILKLIRSIKKLYKN